MAKGNLFLGTASGKVGDVVFARDGGEQISRVRVRHPRNPQTPIQLLQRVLFKTSSSAFSLLQDICNHSFQNIEGKVMNQARFNKLNVAMFREQCADLINVDNPEAILSSELTNFTSSIEFGAAVNKYKVSEGTLPTLRVGKETDGFSLQLPGVTSDQIGYNQVVEHLGLNQGDQLTFLVLGVNDTDLTNVFCGFGFARIILDTEESGLDTLFCGSSFDDVLSPNPNNEGLLKVKWTPASGNVHGKITFYIPGFPHTSGNTSTACAATVIASHRNGDVWQYSSQQLILRSSHDAQAALLYNHNNGYLGDAVRSLMTQANSSLYLNQAE